MAGGKYHEAERLEGYQEAGRREGRVLRLKITSCTLLAAALRCCAVVTPSSAVFRRRRARAQPAGEARPFQLAGSPASIGAASSSIDNPSLSPRRTCHQSRR